MLATGFNTSHVVIYLVAVAGLTPFEIGFNTSHVVIYQE